MSFGKYNQISTNASATAAQRAGRSRFANDVLEIVGAFIGLTAVVVYGNFWYDFAPYVSGSEFAQTAEYTRVLLVNACICVALGIIAFIMEREACGCSLFSSGPSSSSL